MSHFTWIQDSGEMLDPEGNLVQKLYAGCGIGRNNPAMQGCRGEGPLPCGWYTIGPLEATHTTSEGHVLTDSAALIPDPENEMFGRSGFRLHGRKSAMDQDASNGCPILDHGPRMSVLTSECRRLRVIATLS